ncbi:hypothetical protein BDZ94DRAFT_1235517 [Collybia nuda]|uniref:Uncharacterized protein n=1 Tax=Collybia nuda TaxID=64659 RepID=A0A9P6CFN2_9AGAR|nr:hypothetical protein BDZ94DRAFT_1235517 [Collybia nuda]
MLTTNGIMESDGSQLRAVFIIDQVEYIYTSNTPMYPFQTLQAVLTYDSVLDLVGDKTYDCILGINNVNLRFGDGTGNVAGILTEPVEQQLDIHSFGTWIFSKDYASDAKQFIR